ncbi:MAG: LamG domain-containing protein [Verrucomicrobiota bacterium]
MFIIGVAGSVQGAATLVSHFNFDEGAGAVTYDAMGVNDGAIIGEVDYSTDTPYGGHSLFFEGVNEFVDVGTDDNAYYYNYASISVAFWAKPTADNADNAMISIGAVSSDIGLQVYAFKNPDDVLVQLGDGSNTSFFDFRAPDTPAFELNQWTHVAVTFDDATKEGILYLNGIVVETYTSPGSILYRAGPIRIGGKADRPNGAFAGFLDEVRIYDGVLTQPEVAELLTPPVVVPEPSSVNVLGVFLLLRRRRRESAVAI